MRKFSYLLVVLFSFFMLSCSRDEDNKTNVPAQPQQLDNVVGSWALVEMRMKGNITVGGGSPTPIDMQVPLTSCEKKTITTFLPDGTGSTEVWAAASGTCDKLKEGNITYTFDKNTRVLIVTLGTETSRSIVRKLTSTEMEAEENVVSQEVGGVTFTGTVYSKVKKF